MIIIKRCDIMFKDMLRHNKQHDTRGRLAKHGCSGKGTNSSVRLVHGIIDLEGIRITHNETYIIMSAANIRRLFKDMLGHTARTLSGSSTHVEINDVRQFILNQC